MRASKGTPAFLTRVAWSTPEILSRPRRPSAEFRRAAYLGSMCAPWSGSVPSSFKCKARGGRKLQPTAAAHKHAAAARNVAEKQSGFACVVKIG